MKIIIIPFSLLFLFAFTGSNGIAQGYLKSVQPDDFKGNFKGLTSQIDTYYDTATTNRGGYKQWKRWEWFAMHHLDEKGQLTDFTKWNDEAVQSMAREQHENNRSATGDWFNVGHASMPGDEAKQGRVNSVAFDPTDGNVVYAATAGGGIWKTYDNGASWINLTIDLPILGIADIVVAPAPNNNIVYALTGDVTGGANIYLHNSIGVIKSFDYGFTWIATALKFPASTNVRGYKLLMDPNNINTLYAAMTYGICRTTDGGVTWNVINTSSEVNDMEFDLNHADSLYFVIKKNDNLFKLNLNNLGIRQKFITGGIDRMEIAVTPDNRDAVFILAGPGYLSGDANLFNGLYYSWDSANSFIFKANSCADNGDLFNSKASFAWYANTLFVDPNEENHVFVGGKNFFSSTNGGTTLTQITSNSIHADMHNLKRNPFNGDLWLCNDGGVYRSTDNGVTWNNRSNGLIINEYYRISGTNDTYDLILGGTQDNGHFLRDAAGDFKFVMDGDGMDNYFNSFDPSKAYACSQNGNLKRSYNYGLFFGNTTLPNAGDGAFFPWVTPIVQQPPHYSFPAWQNTDVIYVYSLNGIQRCVDGANWTGIGPTGIGASGTPSMVICADDQNNTNLYISNGNSFWACFNPMDNVPNWNLFALPIGPDNYISAMAVNPAVRTEVWAVISGYAAGVKVFRSQNSGLTWTNVSLSLPNVPVYSIQFANNTNNPTGAVYIGTEIGVYYKDDAVPNWVPFSNGLPHVPVTDLLMNFTTNELKAATYGRGIWRSDLHQPCSSLVLVDFDIHQGQYDFESSNQLIANRSIDGALGVRVRMKAANQIRLTNGFHVYEGSDVKFKIAPCGSGIIGFANMPKDSIMEAMEKALPNVTVNKDEDEEDDD